MSSSPLLHVVAGALGVLLHVVAGVLGYLERVKKCGTIQPMVITYHGDRCFKIQSGKLSIVSDPLPRFKGDIVLHTQEFSTPTSKGVGAPTEASEFPIEAGHIIGPGEYEIQETEIRGYSNKDGSTNYVAAVEEVRLCFLGSPLKDWEPGLLEKFGEIDILFTPAGIEAKVIKQLQPKIVIPFYKKPDELKSFLKEIEKKAETLDKLVIKKKDLAPGTRVVELRT